MFTMAVYTAVVLAFALMFLAMPYYSDDLWYMSGIREYFLGQSDGYPLQGVLDTIRVHYGTDTGRLSNMVFMALLPLPHFITALSGCVALALTLRSMLLKADAWGKPMRQLWLCILFVCAMPWHDQMVFVCYQFNYLWASALALWWLSLFLRRTKTAPVPALIVGLLCGMWHEGFAIPLLLAGTVVMVLYRRDYLDRGRVTLLLALMAGLLPILLAGGLGVRLELNASGDITGSIVSCLRYHPLMLLYLVLLVLGLLWRRTRRSLLTPLHVFLVVSVLTVFAMHVRFNLGLRVGWFGELLSCIGIVLCGAVLSAGVKRWLKVVLTAVGATFMFAHLAVADFYSIRIGGEIRDGIEAFRHSDDGLVFMDYSDEFDAPLISLEKPYFNHFTFRWLLLNVSAAYDPGKTFRPVPRALEYVTAEAGESFAGIPGLRRVGRYFFISADSVDFAQSADDLDTVVRSVPATVTFGAEAVPRTLLTVPFVSHADGHHYYYLYPENSARRALFRPITAIALHPQSPHTVENN